MKKTADKKIQKTKETPKIINSFVLIVYSFVTVFTPNMRTFDSNGPKFLTFGILNLLVFVGLYFGSKIYRKQFFGFFSNKIGIAITVLLFFTLVSFSKSININESILHFTKLLTAFVAIWLISILVKNDKRSVLPLAVVMSVLLILDSVDIYKGIADYISGKIASVRVIKSSYSNANILASAVFMKLPFAFWLSFFAKKWVKYIGTLALTFGILAIFFISSRAFYVGLFFISLLLFVYTMIHYKQNKKKGIIQKFVYYFISVLFSFGIFTMVEKTMYPKKGKKSFNIGNRLSSIVAADNKSNNLRLTAWGQSLKMIKKDPLLGVGVGNWKLRVLEYENQYSPSYTYMYKNHNDFLEITVESGIFAGIAFISIFALILWYFARVLLKKSDDEWQQFFFLPAFGIVAYAFDAFFNFPQDRPEIQSLFSLYVGVAVGGALLRFKSNDFLERAFKVGILKNIIAFTTTLLLIGSVYILYLNVQSLKLQRIIKEEINSKKLKSSSTMFLNEFPSIPDITILAEPIAVQKARYLINEKKYVQARKIMLQDNSNPLDGRKEFFIAKTFYDQKKYDSAIYYGKLALNVKPYFYSSNAIVASSYEKQRKKEKSLNLWLNYLKGYKKNSTAWLNVTNLYRAQGQIEKAVILLDSARKYLPNDKKLKVRYIALKQKMKEKEYASLYNKALNTYRKQNYKEAIPLLSAFLKKAPNHTSALEYRATCYFKTAKYNESLQDLLQVEKIGIKLQHGSVNIKGAAYFMLGDKVKAKKYFKRAMDMGNKSAADNYKKLFPKKKNKENTKKSILFK